MSVHLIAEADFSARPMAVTCCCGERVEGFTSEQIEQEWSAHRRKVRATHGNKKREYARWSVGRSEKLYGSYGFDR